MNHEWIMKFIDHRISDKNIYRLIYRFLLSRTVSLGTDIHGNITRLNNALAEIPKKLEYCREQLITLGLQRPQEIERL